MKVLIVGRGGREHALCATVALSSLVEKVYVSPGNPGMADCATLLSYSEEDHQAIVEFSKEQGIGLVIIGPEKPLVEGLADRLLAEGIQVFAPTQRAAQIEGSKSFAKELMEKYGIPTARYRSFVDFDSAKEYVEHSSMPVVIKADGLAAGKGVVIAQTQAEAMDALTDMLLERRFGDASSRVIVEEFLEGEEFSLMALVQGELVVPLDVAQDHKRAFDGDLGPNTGGMGAYSPVPQIPAAVIREATVRVLEPTARALKQEGMPFTGILYAGLILTKEGPKVIEFNARFGDPETQVLLPRLESDLVEAILSVLQGQRPEIKWSNQAMVGVVVASRGYPGPCQAGALLPDFESEGDLQIFYSGVGQNQAEKLISSGGRVYLAASRAACLQDACREVYRSLARYDQPELFYRTDIGQREINKSRV
ncbi:MAG TPA: phosphoribosylamine--glycine ligase [Limnochordia bacterium]|nr:phosphoribosylamine--glycine ligase [Limnochordia bacterium]